MADRDRPEEDKSVRDADEVAEEVETSESSARVTVAPPSGKGGFFHVYKPGQGYWTRMGTFVSALLIIGLFSRFLYVALATRTALDTVMGPNGVPVSTLFPVWKVTIVGVLTVVALGLLWWYLNKPSVVDFLVATESEMKKVNWTSRADLIGSTKIVIVFMLLIAAALFVIDVIFGYFFYMINVLKTGPFA